MPPIQITRAEYERKFGVKPFVSSTSILEDEKPAPIRITRAEWNALQEQWKPQTVKQDGLGTKLIDRAKDVGDAMIADKPSDLVPGRSLLRVGGAITGAGADIIGAAISPVFQKLTDMVSNIPAVQKFAMKKGTAKVLDITNDAVNLTQDKWKEFEESNPEVAQDIRDVTNIASFIPVGKGAQIAGEGVAKVSAPIVRNFDERGVNNVVKEIEQIENKYVKTRNANTYSKDTEASRRRIAESNVLDGAVDNNGLIQTKVAGGAIDQYRAQTIDGFEDIVRKKLADTKETMPFADVGKALKIEIGRSGLEGADLVTALKKIEKELEGLSVRTKGSSIIDLTYLQDAKIATTKNINYLTPPEKRTYRTAVARAYKVLIEKNSTKFDVKEVNEGPLARAYEDIARLERLDGARAEGGRLGKYTASLAGTAIGMAAGSVGGGFGAAVGGVVGGELAQAMKGAGMSRTFKGGGKGLTPDPLLVKTKLSIPDKPVNAKAGIKKTKEITELESQIAKNVADQKKAIKKGDFALVQALKEIYQVLVEELTKIIKDLNDNASLGLSIRKTVTPESVAKKADSADIQILAKVIDDPSLAKTDPDVRRVLSDMGLGRATEDEVVRFAKEVIDEKDGVVRQVATKTDITDPKKYKITVNIQDKNDIEYLERILSRDSIEDIKNGKMTNWRGDTYEDLARVNIVSETPKTIAQQLEGRVSDIKLKSNTFYHGTSAENAKGIMGGGFKTGGSLPESTFRGGGYGKMQNSISLAETPKEASIFSELTRNGEIVEVKLKDNAKVVSIKGVEDANDLEDYISYLKKEKIDAVYIGGGEKELVVINPKAVVPTKSQLTEIWKKANRKASEAEK